MHSTSNSRLLTFLIFSIGLSVSAQESPVDITSSGDIEWASDEQSLQITGDVEIIQDPFRLLSDSILMQEDFSRIQAIGSVRLYYNTESEQADFELPEFQPFMVSENLPAERKLLEAERLIFNTQTQLVEPVGAAEINLGLIRVLGRDLKLNFEDNAFETQQYRVGMAALYLEGDALNYADEVLVANNARFFFGEPEALSIQGRARKITKTEDNKLRMEGIRLSAGPVPFFYWPRYTHNLERSQFSISGSAGYSGDFGAYLRLRPKYSPNNAFTLHTDTNYYIERGFLFGPGFSLEFEDLNNHTLRTNLETGYINDSGILGRDIFFRPIEPDRYYADLDLVYRYGNNLQVMSQVQSWSDSEIVRDFDGGRFRQIQQPENFAEINYQYGPFVASVFTRYALENFEFANEKLPEINLELLPSQFLLKDWYHSFKTSYSRINGNWLTYIENIENDQFQTYGQLLRDIRFPWYFGISEYDRFLTSYKTDYVINISDWLDFSPTFTTQVRYYNQGFLNRNIRLTQSGSIYNSEVGFDLTAHLFREWDINNKVWNIDQLRHVLNPIISFRSIFYESGLSGYQFSERPIFTTGLPNIELNNLRSTDLIQSDNVIRLGFKNTFFAKTLKSGEIKNLAEANLYYDHYASNVFGRSRRLVTTELNLSPSHWINLNWQARFNANDYNLSDSFANLEISNGDIWRAQIGSQFISRALQQYLFYFDYKLTESVKFLSVLGYDADEGNLYEQSYGLQFGVGNYWDILIGVRDRSGSRRNNDLRLEFKVVTAQF